MTRRVITVTPDTPVEEAARLIVQKKIGCLPVLEEERLMGIVTRDDLLAALVDLLRAWTNPPLLAVA
jgi:CBS domain-containing protein